MSSVQDVFTGDNFKLAVAHEEMNSRRRSTMEDCHRIIPVLHNSLPHCSFLGIYDGHGGRQIVDFLENQLENQLAEELLEDDGSTMEERITRAFLITDMKSRQLNITTSGATAVVSIIQRMENTRLVHVANVGDSRAVLVSKSSNEPHKTVVQRLSYDHRADDPAEQSRISAAGGFVTRNRVLGILAVSRSFGDHGMKDFVIAEPHVVTVDLNTIFNPSILILACDGVWDVLTDLEAGELLMEKFSLSGPFADAARYLVDEAIERGSADNVTAIVVFL